MPSRPAMPMQSMRPSRGRWSGVPGGDQAYRRPSYGYQLPSYWTAAPFYISDWDAFGLPRPAEGFGWSRYYDDVVLTDAYGRVYDVRDDVDFSGDARWRDEDYGDNYGYRDDRRERRNRRPRADAAHGQYSYDGRWTGSWDGGPVRTYDGRFDGNVRTHWSQGHGGYAGNGGYDHAEYGYSGYSGYADAGYGGASVTTVIVQPSAPVVTRTVSYVTEYVRVPMHRTAKRTWKPRRKSTCGC